VIPKECKRLAEVDFPIAVVSKYSTIEKSIRHGHPSTLHLWWARRPLAACRAILLALLLPDPCDENCPDDFKTMARSLLANVQGNSGAEDIGLRKAILKFIGDFSNWNLASNPSYLEVGRGLVKAAHGAEAPLVVDPFAGGGSIPLEALRLGCEAFASDLNPVACLILKVMLEDIPRHGPKLADELRRFGSEIKKQAHKELDQYYSPDPDGARPIAYLWARTVTCESPNCGAEIPLARSFWLCKKPSRLRALKYEVKRPKGKSPQIEFEVFQPKSEKQVPSGTVARGNATCPACERVLPVERVRIQLRQQRGGADTIFGNDGRRIGGARLLAVVTLRDNVSGRQYRVGANRDYEAVSKAQKAVAKLGKERLADGSSSIPNEPLPERNTNSFRIPNYGIKTWADISTARQKCALAALTGAVRRLGAESGSNDAAVINALSLAVSRCSDFNSSLNSWANEGEFVRSTFARQALSMVWDFCETMPLTTESGGYDGALGWVALVLDGLTVLHKRDGQVQLADACASPLADEAADVWFTDPPYYNAVGYAELSDFFFVWLKRAQPANPLLKDPFDPTNPLVPKVRECVQDESYLSIESKPKDRRFFEKTVAVAFAEARRIVKEDGIGSVVFAHKTTEGWEALLTGMIKGGWVITGSWPVATERPGRLRSQDSAALATSVHLICRPRPEDAEIGDWGQIFQELPKRIGEWIERLSVEGVRGADLVFACIGPAMELYSRYSKVEDAEGREIELGGDPEAPEPYKRGFLAYVWETVGRIALEQILGTAEARARNGAAGALEEDARLTALFLWTIQSTATNGAGASSDDEVESEDEDEDPGAGKSRKGLTLVYDVARRFAQPLGIHLDRWEDRIIVIEKGIVRLLPVIERAEQLLGEDGAIGAAELIERTKGRNVNYEFAFAGEVDARPSKPNAKTRKGGAGATRDEAPAPKQGTTTLDRVHIAMLLQKSGKSNALRTMLKSEIDRGADFIRLANALSALYPKESEEKRLLDAMLLAAPR
jgi:putative DNA methylase